MMILPRPSFLPFSQTTKDPMARWDRESLENAALTDSPKLRQQLAKIRNPAVLLLGIGIFEWLYDQFRQLPDPLSEMQEFRIALRVANVDSLYFKRPNLTLLQEISDTFDEKSPMAVSMAIITQAVEEVEFESGPILKVISLARRAQHLLHEKTAFESWLSQVLARMLMLAGNKIDEAWGDPLPFDCLDPAIDPDSLDTNTLLQADLDAVDPLTNPFLRAPDELEADENFEGTPYKIE